MRRGKGFHIQNLQAEFAPFVVWAFSEFSGSNNKPSHSWAVRQAQKLVAVLAPQEASDTHPTPI